MSFITIIPISNSSHSTSTTATVVGVVELRWPMWRQEFGVDLEGRFIDFAVMEHGVLKASI